MSDPNDLAISTERTLLSGARSTNSVGDLSASSSTGFVDESSHERHPVDVLADEFAARCRRGEMPSIEEFELRAPEHVAMIRSLFPMIAKIEKVTSQSSYKRRANRQVLPAQKVIGDFQIVREVGRGGMGIVYEAIQRSLDRRVALKVLSSGIANSPLQFQRFRREAEAAARLHHTNIVPVYGIGEENGIHFYAMQYIDGIPLADAIETARQASSVRGRSVFDSTYPTPDSGSMNNMSLDAVGKEDVESDISNPTLIMNADSSGSVADQPASESEAVAAGISGSDCQRRASEVASNDAAVKPSHAVADSGIRATSKELFSRNNHIEDFRRVAHLVAQVADALDYAHQHGVLHRDIKPSNLMLDRGGMVWITDFGLVKILEQHDLTQAGEIVGTLRYMAPEQLEGHADVQTDIYGLGLTLYELMTLTPAFDGDQIVTFSQRLHKSVIPHPRSINPAIPRDLETIVMKATAHEPSARYATAAMLAEDLRRFCEDRPILARRSTFVERFWRWSRRNPALAFASGTSIVLLATIAIVMTVSRMTIESALLDAKSALLDAKSSQKRAEQNLNSAINAFDSILENVTSRGLPRSLAQNISEAEMGLMQTPLSKADALLLDQLLQFYRNFAAENADNFRLSARIADAYERAGAILVRLGRLEEAESDYRAAIESLGRILASDPKNVDVVVKTASLYNEIGKLELRHGDFRETFLAHLEARATLLDLPEKLRSLPAVRFELARSTNLLASIDVRSGTDQGPGGPHRERHEDRENAFDGGPPPPRPDSPPPGPHEPPDSLAKAPDLHRERPPRSSMADGLTERLRQALPMKKQHGESLGESLSASLREASEEIRSLASEFPQKPEYQLRLAQGLRLQLVHAATTGNSDAAREYFLEAREILNRLSTQYPEHPKYLFELANTLTQASRAESKEQAKESLDRAVEIAKQLYVRFPTVSEYQLLYGTALARLASNQAERGSTSEAEQNLTQSIECLVPLAQQFPDQGVIQIPLAKTCQQLGDLLRSMAEQEPQDAARLERSRQELQAAIERFERYLAIPDANANTSGKGQFNTETCSSLYRSLARTLTQLQQPEQAEQARHQAMRYARLGRPARPPAP